MKRAMVAIAACAATLAVAAPTSSAAVHRVVDACQGTATWQLTFNGTGPANAARTLDAGLEGCKAVNAELKDDGNFAIYSEDAGGTVTHDHPLTAASVNTDPAVIVGLLNSPAPGGRGPLVVVGDSLAASLTYVDTSPTVTTEVHTPDGSCGADCWRTNVVFAREYAR